jgi:hypothetical protein
MDHLNQASSIGKMSNQRPRNLRKICQITQQEMQKLKLWAITVHCLKFYPTEFQESRKDHNTNEIHKIKKCSTLVIKFENYTVKCVRF